MPMLMNAKGPGIIPALLILFVSHMLYAGHQERVPHLASPSASVFSGINYEKNKGQWPERVAFKADVSGLRRIFFERDRFTCVVFDPSALGTAHGDAQDNLTPEENTLVNCHAFSMRFVGSQVQNIVGLDEKSFHYNYFLGNDPEKWASDVPVFGSVRYEQLYPGIDLMLHGGRSEFKYDYVVAAGADPSEILIEIIGAEKLAVVNGRLVIQTSVGEITESIPYCFQPSGRIEKRVECRYQLLPGGKRVRFVFPDGYDAALPLIIDPVLMASTYSGSSFSTYGHCATYDAAGNIYTGGRAFGQGYPVTTGAYQVTFGGGVDIAVSKLNPTGTALLYATYLGGSSSDFPHSMFVDINNNLFVYGSSVSNNYPSTASAFDPTANGGSDIVISKLSINGNNLLGSTYLGGSANDGVNNGITPNYGDNYRGEIVVSQTGDVFIAGSSSSANFPTTTGAYDVTQNGLQDAVLAKLNNNLTALAWSTFLGGSAQDVGCSLRVSSNGDVFIVGSTSGNFPTTAGALNVSSPGGSTDGFIARFSSSGSSLLASTYIGTALSDVTYFIDLDFNDDVYIYGTSTGNMPILNAAFSNPNSQNYVCKLNPALSGFIFSTVFGNGTHNTFSPCAFMVDYCQNLYMCGWGNNLNYPISANATQSVTNGSSFYLMALSANAGSLIYGSFFGAGGEHVDGGTSRFDKSGKVYQGVCACSPNFPTLPTAFSPTKLSNGCDIVVFKIDFEVNCNALAVNTVICYGGSTTFTIPNVNGLSTPTYVLQPGNISNNTGIFSFTPQASVSYSATMSGYTAANSLVTGTGVVNIIVYPAPVLTPTVVQPSCLTNTASFNVGLSFLPSSQSTTYSLLWSPPPTGITSNTQLASSGTLAPGVYNTTLTSAGGCKAMASISINPSPDPSVFFMAGITEITCAAPVRTLLLLPATYNYTWTGNSGVYNGSSATFSAPNTGTWTVIGMNNVSGCISSQTFVITTNITNVSSTLTPLQQNINCAFSSVINVTASASPSVNITHMWLSPFGGTFTAGNPVSTYAPTGPGIYTHIVLDNSNGCSTTKTFTVSTTDAYPTFSVQSPQNFTLGCSSKSIITINITGGQTSPPGGPINYTILPAGFSGSNTLGPASSYTNINAPGSYTVVVKDMTNGCITKVPVSVLQNTIEPDISVSAARNVLTCDYPYVVLNGQSATQGVSYNWSFPGQPGNLALDSIRVGINSNVTASLVANYTLTVTDNNNACLNRTVVPVYQNIMPPNALFAGAAPITCKTETLVLTNLSTTRILPVFNPVLAVVAFSWTPPSPLEPRQFVTTYVASIPGVYTLTAKDLNNGCLSTYTALVDDGRDFPALAQPAPQYTLDCGDAYVQIYPVFNGPRNNLEYKWSAAPGVTMSPVNSATTMVNKTGHFEIVVTNTLNGCISSALIEVEEGTIKADFTAEPLAGYAPMEVAFTNLSLSSSTLTGQQNTSVWSFGNGEYLTLPGTTNPAKRYLQPGKYGVKLFVTKGECQDTISKEVEVKMPSSLEVPNIFTPNGDHVNDLFFVHASALEYISCTITDRWGHTVYKVESESGNIEWDGKNQYGKEVAEGVYLYVLNARGEEGEKYAQSGTITLLR